MTWHCPRCRRFNEPELNPCACGYQFQIEGPNAHGAGAAIAGTGVTGTAVDAIDSAEFPWAWRLTLWIGAWAAALVVTSLLVVDEPAAFILLPAFPVGLFYSLSRKLPVSVILGLGWSVYIFSSIILLTTKRGRSYMLLLGLFIALLAVNAVGCRYLASGVHFH